VCVVSAAKQLVQMTGAMSIRAALWRLLELHVFFLGHEPSQLLQNPFDRVVGRPAAQKWDVASVNRTVRVYSVHDDAIDEFDCRRTLRIILAAI